MKLYCLVDNIREDIINVFLCKSDTVAIKTLKQEMPNSKMEMELKLYSLDLSLDFDNDRLYFFHDSGEELETRLIYSFPQDEVLTKDDVVKDIIKKENEEVE